MPGSGGRRLNITQRERGLSVDIKRLQTFLEADLAEMLKHLLDARSDFDENAGGRETFVLTLANPMRGVILSGIRARPEIGTVNLFIEPGVGLFVSPDTPPDADDSAHKWVIDPGVLTAGQLTLTANASGSTRIDIVECQIIDELVSSETREVFVTSAGTFNPQLVEKVKRRRLGYRIRTGTPAAGFPGTVLGWYPLAVCSVPNGAATWDTVIVWDVRGLASDMLFQPFQILATNIDWKGKQHVSSEITPFSIPATNIKLRGQVEASHLGRRAGGLLDAKGGTDGWIDILDTANQVGTPFVANRPWYLWALFPHGLPRWCRLSPASSGSRVPGPFRGIPVVSSTGPGNMHGRPASTIALPTALGFTGSSNTNAGALIVAGLVGSAVDRPWGVEMDGSTTWHVFYGTATAIAGTSSGDSELWALVDNTQIPANCRAVHLEFKGNISSHAVSVRHQLAMRDFANAYDTWTSEDVIYLKPAIIAHDDRFQRRMPCQSSLEQLGLKTRNLRWTHGVVAQGGTVGTPTLTIKGWELGP